jgi:tRNA/rRNA methyltransferase
MNAPVIILVEPQLAENIGMVARAMANFGLSELRLVAPRDGWPNEGARAAAVGAVHLLDAARLCQTTAEAIGDLNYVLATTARSRGQMKRVLLPEAALADVQLRGSAGQRTGILFGRERTGLENDEISLSDAIVTFPVDPAFSSLNLAQAVLLVAYEWQRATQGGVLPFGSARPPPAAREMLISFFDYIESRLDAVDYFPDDKRSIMVRNMRDVFHRLEMTEQDVRTLRGAFRAVADGRRVRKP